MSVSLERKINNIENSLSELSPFPIIGTVMGVSKIFVGATQLLTATALAIFALIPAAIGDFTLLNHSWTHIKHGLGNVVAGVIEALPIIQTIFYLVRMNKGASSSDAVAHLRTGHENKFMPYASLIEEDWHIAGALPDEIAKLKEKVTKKIEDEGGIYRLTKKRQLEFAYEVAASNRA
jgi:hypothetical protein